MFRSTKKQLRRYFLVILVENYLGLQMKYLLYRHNKSQDTVKHAGIAELARSGY